ncbi:p53 and DNA damage-regulated protein 1 [Chironomus tepperi]|uniref:p53 and DNA damage-regulated protein 1 n=1 Tax=Chironomus tepperi TaxID=113505 RepID=UPI00391FC268
MSVNTKVYEIILENERVADQILQNKHLIVEYDKKRQGNREALRELRKSEEKNVWMTVGSILIEMERPKAIDALMEEQRKIDKEIDKLRDEQLQMVKKHKDLEMDIMPSGFDLKPLNKTEMSALKNNLNL